MVLRVPTYLRSRPLNQFSVCIEHVHVYSGVLVPYEKDL
jgi:hypothetical protein